MLIDDGRGSVSISLTARAPTRCPKLVLEGNMAEVRSLEKEVAQLIVETLNLEMDPAEIEPDSPLFGEGLGLDSIDALELALMISKRYGFQLRSDDERNEQIFSSLRELSRHIDAHRVKD